MTQDELKNIKNIEELSHIVYTDLPKQELVLEPLFSNLFKVVYVTYNAELNEHDDLINRYLSTVTYGYKLNKNKLELYLHANFLGSLAEIVDNKAKYTNELTNKHIFNFFNNLNYCIFIYTYDKYGNIIDTIEITLYKFNFNIEQSYNQSGLSNLTIQLDINNIYWH